MAALRKALKSNPKADNKTLQAVASKIDKAIAKLPPKSFHGKFGLKARKANNGTNGNHHTRAAAKQTSRPALGSRRAQSVSAANRRPAANNDVALSPEIEAAIAADSKQRVQAGVIELQLGTLVQQALKARTPKQVSEVLDQITPTAKAAVRSLGNL